MRRVGVVVTVLLLLLTACGSDPPVQQTSPTAPPPSGDLLECESFTITPDDLKRPYVEDESADPAAAEARKNTHLVTEQRPPLRRLAEQDDRVLFGLGDPKAVTGEDGPYGNHLSTVVVQRQGDGYRFYGSGGCTLRPHIEGDGHEWASWRLNPSSPPRPDSTELALLVNEFACSGGRTVEGRIDEPRIEYGPDTVTIGITTRPLDGSQTCPGPPPTPYRVKLKEPLGDRTLLDGGHWPPIPPPPCDQSPFGC